jgi:hypothetical protein
MRYQIFSENVWIYPDTELTSPNSAELHAPRGADVCFQVLTDHDLRNGETITAEFAMEGCEAVVYQLLTATVPLNSHAKMLIRSTSGCVPESQQKECQIKEEHFPSAKLNGIHKGTKITNG